MYGSALVMMNWMSHCVNAAKVPVRLRRAPGKISADTIHLRSVSLIALRSQGRP